jgi:predicted Zn-dependent protease
MPTAKDEVRELLDQLPDDSSLDDMKYHIYVRQKKSATASPQPTKAR